MNNTIQFGFWSPNGRINRRIYWVRYIIPIFFVQLTAAALYAAVLFLLINTSNKDAPSDDSIHLLSTVHIMIAFLSIVPLIGSIAAFFIGQIKRLHDLGRGGTWVVLNFAPIFGVILLFYLGFKKGERGTNEYGHNPNPGKRKR